VQVTVAIVIMAVAISVCLVLYFKNLATVREIEGANIRSVEDLNAYVIKELSELIKDKTIKSKNDREYEIARERKIRIEEAFTNCLDGKMADKNIIKDLISKIISTKFKTFADLNTIFNFDQPQVLNGHYKLEILFEYLYNDYTLDAMSYLIHKYNLDRTRYVIEDGTVPSYLITKEDIDDIYATEIPYGIDYTTAISVASTIVYEAIKGFGCVDTLLTMNVDGLNIGTSGSIMNSSTSNKYPATQSIWLYFEGKHLHLRFLDMMREEEVRRVITLIARYNNPGPLTERRGFLVNTMHDHSRVLALRPPASEYWAVFVRKFVLKNKTLEGLLDPQDTDRETGQPLFDDEGQPIKKYHNAFLPIKLIQLHMEAKVTTAFTGRQGSGKTTTMSASIKPVDGRYNVRVLELAPELYLRELYPERNVLSVAETPYITAEMLQDALKKSDAALTIVGEVATNVVAARMLQMGQVATIFTIFSHHAVTTEDLVHAITNSVVADSGGTLNPETVEPQVLEVIKADVHQDYDTHGNRYIERITEIIRLDNTPYPLPNDNESSTSYDIRLRKEFYERMTDRKHFEVKDIIRFDHTTFTYYTVNMYSPELLKRIMHNLEDDVRDKWRKWLIDTWSGKYDINCCKQYPPRYVMGEE